MANHVIPENPQISLELQKLRTTDRAHADIFNNINAKLIENDAYLEKEIRKVAKEGIQLTTDSEFVNSLISNTAKAGSVLLFSNIGERNGNVTGEGYTLYAGLMNCNRYSGCDITVKPVNMEEQSLHPMHFQSPNFFIAKVDKQNAKRVVIYPLGGGNVDELSERLDSVEEKANQAFQSARDGKIKLANAITSKGQVVSNTASFETMAQKIRDIKVGKYDVGDILQAKNYVPFSTSFSTQNTYVYFPNTTETGFHHFKFFMVDDTPHCMVTYKTNNQFKVKYKSFAVNYQTGAMNSFDLTSSFSEINIPLDEPSNLLTMEFKKDFVFCVFRNSNGGKKITIVVYDRLNNTIKSKTLESTNSFNHVRIFWKERCFVMASNKEVIIETFNGTAFVTKKITFHSFASNESIFFCSPYGYYTQTWTGQYENRRGVLKFYDGTTQNHHSQNLSREHVYLHQCNYSISPVNSLFHSVYFSNYSNYSRYYYIYRLDYENHKLEIVSSNSSADDDDFSFMDCREYPMWYGTFYEYGGFESGIKIFIPKDFDKSHAYDIRATRVFSKVTTKADYVFATSKLEAFFLFNVSEKRVYLKTEKNVIKIIS